MLSQGCKHWFVTWLLQLCQWLLTGGEGGGGGLSGIDCGCNITQNMSSASGISKNNGSFKVCVLIMVKPLMQEHVEY